MQFTCHKPSVTTPVHNLELWIWQIWPIIIHLATLTWRCNWSWVTQIDLSISNIIQPPTPNSFSKIQGQHHFPHTPWDWTITKVTRNLLYMTFAKRISCKPLNAGYLQYFYLLPTKTQRRSKQLRPRTSPKSMVRTERPKEFCMAKLEQASQTKRGERGLF